ncbi:hypothetical protein BYT27DRAFT_7193938 [Phlegmacium glaucopus]|nr:hypothetical protein BYT27DRAFT_7193938 [Phlegmacium glaucopus]
MDDDGRISPASSDIGVIEDGLGGKQDADDAWKWSAPPPPRIHFTPLESTLTSMAKPISKSVSKPLPLIPLPLPMSEGKLIDFHSGPEEEHVLVDLDVQDDDNVPQQEKPEFTHVHRTHVDLDLAATEPTDDVKPLDEPPTVRSHLEGRRSLDSLLKPIADTTTPVEIQHRILSSVVEESSQRGRRIDRHPLEEEVEEVPAEVPADEDKDRQERANEHENHELYDHHDDYSYTYNMHHDHDHSPQSLDTIQGEGLHSSPSSTQVATIPVQAAPAWYWDHEDDPWNGAVEGECGEGVVVEQDNDERGVDLMNEKQADLEVGEDEDTVALPVSNVLELPVEHSLEVPIETEDEESYPDPDYLPLPELLLGCSPVAVTELPLVLVEDEPPNNFQEDSEYATKRVAAQMPTPPASPPPFPLRVKEVGHRRRVLLKGYYHWLPLCLCLPTSLSTSPILAPLLVLTPLNTSLSPAMEVQVNGDKENAAGVDKENEMPNNDAPALVLGRVWCWVMLLPKRLKSRRKRGTYLAFPGLLKHTSFSDTNTILAPTITVAALTSTLLSTSIAATSSVSSAPADAPSTALETPSPLIQR